MRFYEHGGDIYSGAPVTLDFSVNTHPLGMVPEAAALLARSTEDFALYPDARCRRLTQALSIHWGVDESQILCGGGAADLIFRVCAALRPRVVLTLSPTFSEYGRPARLFGGELREHRLLEENGFLPTEALLCDITEDVDVLFFCNPNNPTGQLCPPALMEKLLERCRETGTVPVIDECFLPFTEGASVLPYLEWFPQLLILRAFTKLYAMAGLRLGVLLGQPALLSRIAPFGPEWAVSVPAQLAGEASLLAEPGWTENTRRYVAQERARMSGLLQEAGLTVYPGAANFLLCRGDPALAQKLEARGILVRRCGSFAGLDDSFIRIGLKTKEKDDALLRAIQEVLHG